MAMTDSENTSVVFRCPGHCHGISTCPHAELVYGENWELIAVKCKLPKLIAPNTWLMR